MKEIKFKGKVIDEPNEWVYGYCVEYTFKDTVYMNGTSPKTSYIFPMDERNQLKCLQNYIEVIPKTICEYTGIKDKNGVEIYENDIISATEHLTNGYIVIGEVDLYYEVNYIDRLSKYALNPRIINGKYNSNNFELDMFHYKAEDIEVIGNIFDNSELLEKSDKDE